MKKLLVFSILATVINTSYAAVSGELLRSTAEINGTPPVSATTYDRDCNGRGKPRGMASTIVTAGNTVTTTETDGVNTWVSTVITSGGTVTVSCAHKQ